MNLLPESDIDPFSAAFFEDPFPAHAALREAGPVVRLTRYGVFAVARYAEVHRILNDWQTFCSGRGADLTDFAKEKAWRPRAWCWRPIRRCTTAPDGCSTGYSLPRS
jgi:4-methoxybenzoate monooxygenase (O-demethylating)